VGIFDDIVDIGEDFVDAAAGAAGDLVEAGADLFEGAEQLAGIAVAAGALFVIGPGAVIPAFIAGSAASRALIRQRHMTDAERAFAESVFGRSLPPNDRIFLTNLTGLEGRKFVCPNMSGQMLVNLGGAYDDPVSYRDAIYPAPGKVFIHELTHVWQLHHATFVPGLVCEGIGNQLAGATYQPGEAGRPWAEYNLEQQATIVDEWFAPGTRGPSGFPAMAAEHPFFRYVCVDIRGERLPGTWHTPYAIAPPGHADFGAITAFSRDAGTINVFWIGPDGGVGGNWSNDSDGWHAPYAIAPPGHAAPGAITAHARRRDHVDVFWIGRDGGVGSTWYNDASGWGTPSPIAPPGHAAPGAITAHSRHPEHIDVFWIGPDGGVGGNWWG
jgi:hypothetical protein